MCPLLVIALYLPPLYQTVIHPFHFSIFFSGLCHCYIFTLKHTQAIIINASRITSLYSKASSTRRSTSIFWTLKEIHAKVLHLLKLPQILKVERVIWSIKNKCKNEAVWKETKKSPPFAWKVKLFLHIHFTIPIAQTKKFKHQIIRQSTRGKKKKKKYQSFQS